MEQEPVGINEVAESIFDMFSVCWTTPNYKKPYSSDNSSEEEVNISPKVTDPADSCYKVALAITDDHANSSVNDGHVEKNSDPAIEAKYLENTNPEERKSVNIHFDKKHSDNITLQENNVPNNSLTRKDLTNGLEKMNTNIYCKDQDLSDVPHKNKDSNIYFEGNNELKDALEEKDSINFYLDRKDALNVDLEIKHSVLLNNFSAAKNIEMPNATDNSDLLNVNYINASHAPCIYDLRERQSQEQINVLAKEREETLVLPIEDKPKEQPYYNTEQAISSENLTQDVLENQSSELFGSSCPYDLRNKAMIGFKSSTQINNRNCKDVGDVSNYSSSDAVSPDPDWRWPKGRKLKYKKKRFRSKRTVRKETFSLPCWNSTPTSVDVYANSEKAYACQGIKTNNFSQSEFSSCFSHNKTESKRGRKRKGSFENLEEMKVCYPVFQNEAQHSQQSSILKYKSTNNIGRSWDSTIKVKRMLLDVGSALNQIEAVLTDWKYESRIPTSKESSSLLKKIQKINEDLTEGYYEISKSTYQPGILEDFLDYIKKSEDISFTIQRRIKQLNRKCFNSSCSNRVRELFRKLKFHTPLEEIKIKCPEILKKPSLSIRNDFKECASEHAVPNMDIEHNHTSSKIISPLKDISINKGFLQNSSSNSFKNNLKRKTNEINNGTNNAGLNPPKKLRLLKPTDIKSLFYGRNEHDKNNLNYESFLKTGLSKMEGKDLSTNANESLEECIDTPEILQNGLGEKTLINLKKYRKSTLKLLSQNEKHNENQLIPNRLPAKDILLNQNNALVLESQSCKVNSGNSVTETLAPENESSNHLSSNHNLEGDILPEKTGETMCIMNNSQIFNNEKRYLTMKEKYIPSSLPQVDCENKCLPAMQCRKEKKPYSLNSLQQPSPIIQQHNEISTPGQYISLNGKPSVFHEQTNNITSFIIDDGNVNRDVSRQNMPSYNIIPFSYNENLAITHYVQPLAETEIEQEKQSLYFHKKSIYLENTNKNISLGTKLVSISTENFSEPVPIQNEQSIDPPKINSSSIWTSYGTKHTHAINFQGDTGPKSNQVSRSKEFPTNNKPMVNRDKMPEEVNKANEFVPLLVQNNQDSRQSIKNNNSTINIDASPELKIESSNEIDENKSNASTYTSNKDNCQIIGKEYNDKCSQKSLFLKLLESDTLYNFNDFNNKGPNLNLQICSRNEKPSSQNSVEENIITNVEECEFPKVDINTEEFLRDSLDINFTECPIKEMTEKLSSEEFSLLLDDPAYINYEGDNGPELTESGDRFQALAPGNPFSISVEETITMHRITIFQQTFSAVKYQSGEKCLMSEEYNSGKDLEFNATSGPSIIKNNASNNFRNRRVTVMPFHSSVSPKLSINHTIKNASAPKNINGGFRRNYLYNKRPNFKQTSRTNIKSNDPLQNIKYIRVKSEGEYLSAKDLCDFSSPSNFIW